MLFKGISIRISFFGCDCCSFCFFQANLCEFSFLFLVYPSQQSVNYNMMSPLHLPQAPQPHPHAQPQHFYQVRERFRVDVSCRSFFLLFEQSFQMISNPQFSNWIPKYKYIDGLTNWFNFFIEPKKNRKQFISKFNR